MPSIITTSTPTTLATCPVPYSLLTKPSDGGGYAIDLSQQGRTEQLTFRVKFADRGAFINFCAGYSTAAGGVVARNQPLTDPFCAYLYCTGMAGKAVGADKGISPARPWTYVDFIVTFSTLVWDPNGSTPYFSVRYRSSTSVASIPGAKLQFATGEYIDHDYGVLLGQFAVELTLFQVPSLAWFNSIFAPLTGFVNSDDVAIAGTTYPAGRLLLPSIDSQSQVAATGSPQSQGTVSLIYRSIPWNSDIDSNGTVQAVTPAPYQATAYAPSFT